MKSARKTKPSTKRESLPKHSEIDAQTYSKKQTEKQFQKSVVQTAELFGWTSVHFPNALINPTGWPDLLLVRNGVTMYVELKVGTNKRSAKQIEWAQTLIQQGCLYFLWYPDDWPKIEEVLNMTTIETAYQYWIDFVTEGLMP